MGFLKMVIGIISEYQKLLIIKHRLTGICWEHSFWCHGNEIKKNDVDA